MKKSISIAIIGILSLAFIVWLTGCAHVDANADPLIVRAEQTERIADSTFSLFLHLEDQNHALVKANAPKIAEFAEWLRAPQPVHGTDMPRASALVYSLNDVKAAYRANRTNSDLLITATATLTEALNKAAELTKTINASK